jgi:type III pantothenate kinase
MEHFTARLPEAPMELPADFIGNSTQTALQNGGLRGAGLEMQGFVGLFEQQFAPLFTVLSGGDAAFFEPFIQSSNYTTEPDLTLYGLNYILNFNT